MKNKNPHRGSSLNEFLEEERRKERRNKIQLTIGLVVVCLLTGLFILQTCNIAKANTTIYTWEAIDGSKAFTDNSKRIPSKYKNQIEQKNIEGLKDYYKYTPIQNEKEHREKLMKRLEELRSK